MKHPTKQQVQVVLDNFEKVLPAAKRLEEMLGTSVFMMAVCVDEHCGTPMCHAGWYQASVKSSCWKSFSDGAESMAGHLGFTSVGALKSWAKSNPKLWGNKEGDYMFCDGSAFGHNSDSLTLQKIVDHWKGVQERLPV